MKNIISVLLSCDKQVKCIECESYVIKDKNKCFKCGTLLQDFSSIGSPMNTFSLEEKQTGNSYSRKVDLSVTDNAINKFSDFISDQIPLNLSKDSRQLPKQQKSSLTTSENENIDQDDKQENGEVIETDVKEISDHELASNYFVQDGNGILIQKHFDYKGKSKKAQLERFLLLYIWAYNILCQEPVPDQKHLREATNKNNIQDSNYTTYLKDISQRYLITPDGTFKLNYSGEEEVKKILLEMEDKELEGEKYWKPKSRNSSKGSRITNEEIEKVNQWVEMPSQLSNFDVRELSPNSHYAIFALYDITKELKVENAVKPGIAYEYLTKRYKNIPIKKKQFSDIFARKNSNQYFERTSEGAYYLTQEGENTAKEWMTEN
ncbi:MAG: hypothetical protein AB4063_09785 [Crocosphaera sp.]